MCCVLCLVISHIRLLATLWTVAHKIYITLYSSSVQSLSCVRLCDPMDCSTQVLPVHHQLLELT